MSCVSIPQLLKHDKGLWVRGQWLDRADSKFWAGLMAEDTTNSYQPLGTLNTQTSKCQDLLPRLSFPYTNPSICGYLVSRRGNLPGPLYMSTRHHQTVSYLCMASSDISIKPRMDEHYSAEPGDHQVRKSSPRDSVVKLVSHGWNLTA